MNKNNAKVPPVKICSKCEVGKMRYEGKANFKLGVSAIGHSKGGGLSQISDEYPDIFRCSIPGCGYGYMIPIFKKI